MEPESEFQEASSITFEWTLRGLKNLFDSTKGEAKSKVTKSARFGGGRWQILFYANAGTTKEGSNEGYVSLYLSCEPTAEEKELALSDSGRWIREGVYKFSFELRNIGKSVLYNLKEANNHSFSYKTANWGWAQFARRDNVYYQSTSVKSQDAFVIICTIASSPTTPPPAPSLPRQPVPKLLLDTVGSLLDDPHYSDVQFIIPKRNQDLKSARRIWASRKLLQRAEYFSAMFSSNFAEGSGEATPHDTPKASSRNLNSPMSSNSISLMDEFEDSDDEDDDIITEPASHDTHGPFETAFFAIQADNSMADSDRQDHEAHSTSSRSPSPQPSHTSEIFPLYIQEPTESETKASGRMSIVIKDVAYTTYKSVLYYLYTDNIVFAPLSSSFTSSRPHFVPTPVLTQPPTPPEGSGQVLGPKRFPVPESSTTRAEWILEWMRDNPGRPAPCSAKAAYRVADKLDLRELKERAAQHIFKSLTVDNIAYEVFSPFAAAFDEVRKVEVNFFLTHWHDIRASEAMRNVWQQIRNGRHPGFEEVWPLIAQSLEFKPSVSAATTTAVRGGDAAQQQ